MKISIEQANSIYRDAIDPLASDGESTSRWDPVAVEVEQVACAIAIKRGDGCNQT